MTIDAHLIHKTSLPVCRQRRVVVAVVAGGGRESGPGRGPRRHVGRPGAGWVALKAKEKSKISSELLREYALEVL